MKKVYLAVTLALVLLFALGSVVWADNDNDEALDEDRDVYFVPVEEITLSTDKMELVVGGQTGILRATIKPEDATNKNIDWSSSDEDVATVEARSDAEVTPEGVGTAYITAITEDGGLTATAEVVVNPDEPTPPTGGSTVWPIILAAGLLAVSGSLLYFKRCRA